MIRMLLGLVGIGGGGGITAYLIGGGLVLVLALGGYAYWQGQRVDSLLQDKATLEASLVTSRGALDEQREELLSTVEAYEETSLALEELERKNRELRRSRDEQNRKLDSYRGRLERLALEDPAALEHRVNRATGRVLDAVTRATGGGEDGGGVTDD